jgi:hypothetical protein
VINDEVRRFARLLESAVRLSKVSAQQLDRKLGLAPGTLNRIFHGKIDLKLRHVLMVCEALGYEPKRFFELAFLDDAEAAAAAPAQQIHAVLRRLGAGGSRLLAPPAPLADSELDERIEAVLRRLGVVPEGAPPEGESLLPEFQPAAEPALRQPPRPTGGTVERPRSKQPAGLARKRQKR